VLVQEIDYRAAEVRSGPQVVEPCSLRRTQNGNLVLFVVNDRGQLRSYRVDRIAGVRPTAMLQAAVRGRVLNGVATSR
jgi:hypothetical protein